jgi:O-antigen/teichoic acid export membrane protein
VEYLQNFIVSMVKVAGPVFSQDEGRNDYESIRHNFLFVTKISVYVSLFCGTLLVLYGNPFIQRWMGAGFGDSYKVLVLLIIPCMVVLMQSPVKHLLYGISKHKYIAYANMAEGVANLILSLWLVRRWGIYGVALGTAIPMVLMAIFVQPFYVCRAIQLPVKSYIRHLLTNGGVAVGSILAVWVFARFFAAPSYGVLLFCIAAQTALYIPVTFAFGFTSEEKQRLLGYIRHAIPFKNRWSAET